MYYRSSASKARRHFRILAGALFFIADLTLMDRPLEAQMSLDSAELEPGRRGGLHYGSAWFFPQSDSEGKDDIGVFRQDLRLTAPILRGVDSLSINVAFAWLDFDADSVFPESGTALPGAVSVFGIGARYAHYFGSGTVVGAALNVGSSGEEPFYSLEEPDLVGVGFARIPAGELDAWRFLVVYATKSEFRFPIILPSYGWQAAEKLRIDIGIPLAMHWRPLRSILIDASYIPLTRVHFQTRWKPGMGPMTLLSGFDWTYEGFEFESVKDEEERMLALAKVLSLGIEYDMGEHAAFDVGANYSFDRVFVLSRDPRESDRIEGSSGFSVSAGVRVKI